LKQELWLDNQLLTVVEDDGEAVGNAAPHQGFIAQSSDRYGESAERSQVNLSEVGRHKHF